METFVAFLLYLLAFLAVPAVCYLFYKFSFAVIQRRMDRFYQ